MTQARSLSVIIPKLIPRFSFSKQEMHNGESEAGVARKHHAHETLLE